MYSIASKLLVVSWNVGYLRRVNGLRRSSLRFGFTIRSLRVSFEHFLDSLKVFAGRESVYPSFHALPSSQFSKLTLFMRICFSF